MQENFPSVSRVRALKFHTLIPLRRIALTAVALVCLCALMPRSRADETPHHKTAKHRKPPPMRSVKALQRYLAALKKADAHHEKTNAAAERREEAQDEEGTDYLEAYLYRMQQRAYPNDSIDGRAYERAIAQREALPAAVLGAKASNTPLIPGGNWQFVGPKNLPVPYRTYYGNSLLNGRVNAVAIDPVMPATYYMATAGGGVFITTDGGNNWTPLSDTWPVMLTSSIAIDPNNHLTLYVGTGDFDGSGAYANGLMKTTDGGQTWTNTGAAQFGGCAVKGLVIDPENSSIITVAPGRGPSGSSKLWRSTDGGTTWTVALNTTATWSGLAYGAADGNGVRHLYACGLGGAGVWRSDNRGVSWTKLTTPTSTSTGGLQVAASPSFPGSAYLVDGTNQKIYGTLDGGATWSDTTHNFPVGSNAYNWKQQYYDIHIECGSRVSGGTTYDVIYVGLIDLVQSPDSGATWRSIGGPTYSGAAILHNDQHTLAVSPHDATQALVGNDGGAYLLTNSPDYSAFSYRSLNAEGNATQFYKIAVHPTDPTRILGGTQDNATPAAVGSLSAWRNVAGGDGAFCAIRDSSTQFATVYHLSVYKTTNGWASSSIVSPNFGTELVSFFAPITLDPPGNYLYAGTDYLYQYALATGTWTNHLGNTLLSATGTIQTIAVAPNNASRIYTGSTRGELWTTGDGGITFGQINTGNSSLPNRAITSIAASPNADTSVLVGVSGTGTGHLWRCADVTASPRVWANVSGNGASALPNIPLNAVVLDLDSPETTWYVATDVGVFMTADAGAHWANMTAPLGLPNVEVEDLKMQAGTRTLYAGTYGRGIWKIGVPAAAYSVSGTIALEGVDNPGSIAPGASSGAVTFTFRPNGGGSAFTRTALLGAKGAFALTNIPAGTYTLAIKASKWLQVVLPVDLTQSDATGLTAALAGGDAVNDNVVDIGDFGVLVNAYGGQAGVVGSGYDNRTDFNCDGVIDIADFGILVNNYGLSGMP